MTGPRDFSEVARLLKVLERPYDEQPRVRVIRAGAAGMGQDARTVLLFLRSRDGKRKVKLNKSKAEWQQQLSPMEYSVTREKGTERAFSGKLLGP